MPGLIAETYSRAVRPDNVDEPPRWKVFGERTVDDNPWVRVVRVDVEPPDGARFEHHVVRLQRVALALVLSDDRCSVLMLRRHRFVTDEVGLELPGGIAETGEGGAQAAARQTLEETGYAVGGGPILRCQPMIGMVDAPHEVFLFETSWLAAEPTDLVEAGVVEWVQLADVVKLIDDGAVLGSGSIVGLLRYLAGRASWSEATSRLRHFGSGDFPVLLNSTGR